MGKRIPQAQSRGQGLEMEASEDLGGIAATGAFGTKVINVYRNGFVQVNKHMGFTKVFEGLFSLGGCRLPFIGGNR